nr:sensor histidine kinase [uncultured Cetobacterium sp.]
MIRNYCRMCSTLTGNDIDKIQKLEETASILGTILNVDIFIDCPTKDKNKAMVVYHSRPQEKSLYTKKIAGELAYSKNEPAVFRTLLTGLPSKNYKAISQEGQPVFQNVVSIKNDNNEIIGVLIIEYSTENKNLSILDRFDKTRENLLDNIDNSREKRISEFVKDGIVVFNDNKKVTYINNTAKQLYKKLGFEKNIRGEMFQNIALNKVEFENILKNKKIDVVEVNILDLVLSVSYFTTMGEKNKKNVIMIIRDLTQEKSKEQELVVKSVAIKEIHHRVKNNLQTIASLLRIQSRRCKNSETKKILDETISRILSIAVTHEVLSENGLDNLNIREIVNLIYKNYSTKTVDKNEKIEFTIEGDNFDVSSEKSTAIALVINEVIQNIVDYAFPDDKNGEVKIKIRKKRVMSQITISDNGVGISENKLLNKGLGLTIIEKIVKDQLNGNLKILSKVGVGTTVQFEIKNEY